MPNSFAVCCSCRAAFVRLTASDAAERVTLFFGAELVARLLDDAATIESRSVANSRTTLFFQNDQCVFFQVEVRLSLQSADFRKPPTHALAQKHIFPCVAALIDVAPTLQLTSFPTFAPVFTQHLSKFAGALLLSFSLRAAVTRSGTQTLWCLAFVVVNKRSNPCRGIAV